MPQEKSAGALIFRMTPVKSAEGGVSQEAKQFNGVKNNIPHYLLLHYESGHWEFAKGHIEKGESEEQTVRRELTADQAPRKTTAPAATEPSIYHVRKQQASQRRKLAGRIKRLEAEQTQHRQELQALEADIAAHPSAWTPERAGRFEALGRLIAEADQRWLQLQEELDALPNE